MNFEEYSTLLDEIIKNPDDLSKVDELRNKLKTDSTAYDEMTAANKASEEKINELRDINLKLYLKTGAEEIKEPEPEPEVDMQELFHQSFGHIFNN